MITLSISDFFREGRSSSVIYSAEEAHRVISTLEFGTCIIDKFDAAVASFLRIEAQPLLEILFPRNYSLQKIDAGGYLATSVDGKGKSYWIPCLPTSRTLGDPNTIRSEQSCGLGNILFSDDKASVTIETETSTVLDVIAWQFDQDFPLQELSQLYPIETQGYFLWGSHGCYRKPADLYNHLINGAVYDLRYSWPGKKKCYSENEAHTLYTCFSGLERSTSKQLYRYFQLQLVLSLFGRQSNDGGFYHGIWTDRNESHYRLHTSAIHLLLDEYQKTQCENVQRILKKAVAFASLQTDELDCGIWYLHDSLELSVQAMNTAPFKWVSSTALGKQKSNMLILNTHLDTSIAISRYSRLTGDTQYEPQLRSALKSTERVLTMKPAEQLYKLLFWIIGLTFLPAKKAAKLPIPLRAIKRFGWKYLIPRLPEIKARYPRLVMPNGYIDRELSLKTWAIDYQTINLMDLGRYNRVFDSVLVDKTLKDSITQTQHSGLVQRYRELTAGKRYAAGFWQEALYHCCLSSKEVTLRKWLFEAIIECCDQGHGVAPSLLGCNGEAVSFDEQIKTPVPQQPGVIMANLSNGIDIEFLIVNITNKQQPLEWGYSPETELNWYDHCGNKTSQSDGIAPRSWIRITTQ